jgi:hypothetical protein
MTTVKEQIEYINKTSEAQDAEGQFETGSTAHRDATILVETYFKDYYKLLDEMPEAEFNLATAATIVALKDLQVRDYMLGIVPEVKNSINILESLIEAAPDLADPARALVATVYYESDRIEDAINTINEADNDYPLASLLKRVYSAGWPKESFAQMRKELHPKVVETIFGEKE